MLPPLLLPPPLLLRVVQWTSIASHFLGQRAPWKQVRTKQNRTEHVLMSSIHLNYITTGLKSLSTTEKLISCLQLFILKNNIAPYLPLHHSHYILLHHSPYLLLYYSPYLSFSTGDVWSDEVPSCAFTTWARQSAMYVRTAKVESDFYLDDKDG